MQLNTITDFDFGVGATTVRQSERVSSVPSNVTQLEQNFILWLLVEQEFRVSRSRRVVDQLREGSSSTDSRTHHDGGDRGRDRSPLSSRTLFSRLDETTRRKARKYAEESLQEAGIAGLLDDLSEEYRNEFVVQLCKNTELLNQGDSFRRVSDIFEALRSSSKFNQEFNADLHMSLGEGGFGKVFHASRKDDGTAVYAIKKISVTFESLKEDVQMALNESAILKLLRGNQNIVRLHDSWLELEQSSTTGTQRTIQEDQDDEYVEGLNFYIQLELCGNSLHDWKEENHRRNIKPGGQQSLAIAKDIFAGLTYIHSKNVLHLDINPRNIVWANPECTHLKIVDFGLAIVGSFCNKTERGGTPGYQAPEQRLTSKSDIYSASVTIIEVTRTIFTASELGEIIDRKIPGVGLKILDELLSNCLDDEPAQRLTAMHIYNTLEFAPPE